MPTLQTQWHIKLDTDGLYAWKEDERSNVDEQWGKLGGSSPQQKWWLLKTIMNRKKHTHATHFLRTGRQIAGCSTPSGARISRSRFAIATEKKVHQAWIHTHLLIGYRTTCIFSFLFSRAFVSTVRWKRNSRHFYVSKLFYCDAFWR